MAVSEDVVAIFLRELASRGFPAPQQVGEGQFQLQHPNGGQSTISLEDISRDFAHDSDPKRIARFVDTVLGVDPSVPLPVTWDEVALGLQFSAEPSDTDLHDVIHERVSDKLCCVLVHINPDGNRITRLTPGLLARFGKSRDEAWAMASRNIDALASQTFVRVENIDEYRRGTFTHHSPFKAALLFATNLKEVVQPVLGWPIYLLLPCRDFVYIIPESDSKLLQRIGHVIVREFSESSYPASTEVFLVSDQGIKALAEFQKKPDVLEALQAKQGMKVINYRGLVRFCIPETWKEEYDEETGTFHPEGKVGMLRIELKTFKNNGPVNKNTAMKLLKHLPHSKQGEVARLPNGNAWLRLREEVDQGVTLWCWEIVCLAPPEHFHVVMFTYATDNDLACGPEVMKQIEMLHRELALCQLVGLPEE